MSAVDPAGDELAFTEARRALEDQDRAVNELRTRAGVLVAAAPLALPEIHRDLAMHMSASYIANRARLRELFVVQGN